jgi:hypothetical protein
MPLRASSPIHSTLDFIPVHKVFAPRWLCDFRGLVEARWIAIRDARKTGAHIPPPAHRARRPKAAHAETSRRVRHPREGGAAS